VATDAPIRALAQLIRSPEEIAPLREAISKAHGEIVDATRGYADELLLDIRDPAGRLWLIGTQGSDWHATGPGRDAVSAEDPAEKVDDWLARLKGATATRVDVDDGLDLVCALDDGTVLLVQAKAAESSPSDPPHWEVFTPEGYAVAAGPGWVWTSRPADVPVQHVPELDLSGFRGRVRETDQALTLQTRLRLALVVASLLAGVLAILALVLDRQALGAIGAVITAVLVSVLAGLLSRLVHGLPVARRRERR
jgi:hypothetical protein